MRLLKHLNEDTTGIEDFWSLAQKKCKPFLKEWLPFQPKSDLLFMYRGMKNHDIFGERDVRQDRKPSSSGLKFHIKVDNIMKQIHGINGRTKSIFVSGSDGQASTYGTSYIIFPIGKYKYLWSGRIRDLYVDAGKYGYHSNIRQWIEREANRMKVDIYDKEKGEEYKRELRKMIEHQNDEALRKMMKYYYTNNLKKAIKSNNEIMFQCESYLYLASNYSNELEDVIVGNV